MKRLLVIPIILFGLEKVQFVTGIVTVISQIIIEICARYRASLFKTYALLMIPVALASLIDWKIMYKMFFHKVEGNLHKWGVFVMLNWVCSSIFVLAFTHLLSFGGGLTIRELVNIQNNNQLNFENRLALILALLSMTYLVGFFGVSLVFNDLGINKNNIGVRLPQNGSSGNLKFGLVSFVPPMYYLGVVAFVWQLDSSLVFRMCVCIAFTMFFSALSLSHKLKQKKGSTLTNNATSTATGTNGVNTTTSENDMNENKSDTTAVTVNNSTPNSSSFYRLYILSNMSTKWWNEFIRDMLIYILPLILYGYFVPSTRPVLYFLSIILAFVLPIFDLVTTAVYLTPSLPENPLIAAERLKTYPHQGKCYANGWYHAMDSNQLAPTQSTYLSMNGKDYVLWRGQDNVVRCLDAHCIHLGANLGVQSKVVNNCIECPFHKWQFDGDGKCVHTPYPAATTTASSNNATTSNSITASNNSAHTHNGSACSGNSGTTNNNTSASSIPVQAKTKAYHVCEYYGMILIHFHSREEKPSYFPPNILKFDNDSMIQRGSKNTIVNMHLNEFSENTTDFAHFALLHGNMIIPFTLLEIPGLKITHRPDWREGVNEESHLSWFSDNADLNFCGIDIPHTAASATITVVGPASLVFFTFETPIGSVVIFQTHTPIEPLRMHTRFRYFADVTMPRLLVQYIVGTWISQWKNDVSIWEHKKFWAKPLLVKGDGPMSKQRRWYKQFYTPQMIELVLEKEGEKEKKEVVLRAGGGKSENTTAAVVATYTSTVTPVVNINNMDSSSCITTNGNNSSDSDANNTAIQHAQPQLQQLLSPPRTATPTQYSRSRGASMSATTAITTAANISNKDTSTVSVEGIANNNNIITNEYLEQHQQQFAIEINYTKSTDIVESNIITNSSNTNRAVVINNTSEDLF